MPLNINTINQNNSNTTQNIDIQRDKSSLNINWTIEGTINVGYYVPTMIREVMPTTRIKLRQSFSMQFFPFVSQLLHKFYCTTHTFFVPYRLLEEDPKKWQDFIQGGIEGNNSYELPSWSIKTEKEKRNDKTLLHTLPDYLTFPIDQNVENEGKEATYKPLLYPIRAYNKIYNMHFRNPDLQEEEVDQDSMELQKCFWTRDYFTASKRWQIRGAIPIVPLSGELKHLIEINNGVRYNVGTGATNTDIIANIAGFNGNNTVVTTEGVVYDGNEQTWNNYDSSNDGGVRKNFKATILPHNLRDDTESTAGFSLIDMIQASGIMSMLINNNNIRYFYNDYLMAIYGAPNQQLLLDMPKKIATTTFKVDSQGVVQTSYGDASSGQTPQGHITTMASANDIHTAEYTANDWGVIMTIVEIRPATVYSQGLKRMLSTRNRFEFARPELVNMPRRAITMGEIFYTGTKADNETFSWTEKDDEYRTEINSVVGLLRPSVDQNLNSFTLSRYFAEAPQFNLDFIQCNADMERVKQYTKLPDAYFIVENDIDEIQPIPMQPDTASLINI